MPTFPRSPRSACACVRAAERSARLSAARVWRSATAAASSIAKWRINCHSETRNGICTAIPQPRPRAFLPAWPTRHRQDLVVRASVSDRSAGPGNVAAVVGATRAARRNGPRCAEEADRHRREPEAPRGRSPAHRAQDRAAVHSSWTGPRSRAWSRNTCAPGATTPPGGINCTIGRPARKSKWTSSCTATPAYTPWRSRVPVRFDPRTCAPYTVSVTITRKAAAFCCIAARSGSSRDDILCLPCEDFLLALTPGRFPE